MFSVTFPGSPHFVDTGVTQILTHTGRKLYPIKWTRENDPRPRLVDTHLTHRVKWLPLWYDEIIGWRYSMGTRKKFTPEELKHLRANPYTLRVTADSISYVGLSSSLRSSRISLQK